MRVLHIGKFFPPYAGGMEYFLADLLPALQQQGTQVATLVHAHRPSCTDSAPFPIHRAPCYGRWLYAPISPQFPLWLARIIRTFKPQILHLHLPNTSAFWAMLIPAARRLPWVIHWHSDVVSSQIDRRLALAYRAYRPLEQHLLANSHRIIVTSPPYLRSSQALQAWDDKCQVIPLGLNPARIPQASLPTPSQTEWQDAHFRVLSVGRLTYYKGHEVLIRAAAQIPDLHLLIVGEGDYRTRLQTLIKTLAVEDRVNLLGFQDEAKLSALLAGTHVFCLPSLERTEAFGLVLLEVMSFAKPVIASDIPGSGVGWVVRQGGHGLLVPPGDTDALVCALQQLSRDPTARAQLGQRGKERLEQLFHINRVAEQIRALYQVVASETVSEPDRNRLPCNKTRR